MKTQHTPGPWFHGKLFPASKLKAERGEHFFLRGIGNGAVHVGYASCTQLTSGDESVANARLIAAAPELLENLERCKNALNAILSNVSFYGHEPLDQKVRAIQSNARAAIDKALGNEPTNPLPDHPASEMRRARQAHARAVAEHYREQV